MSFSCFTDVNGQSLPETVSKMEKMPPQIGSAEEAQAI